MRNDFIASNEPLAPKLHDHRESSVQVQKDDASAVGRVAGARKSEVASFQALKLLKHAVKGLPHVCRLNNRCVTTKRKEVVKWMALPNVSMTARINS